MNDRALRQLTVEGFKRFAALTLDLAPLTVLTGTNGAGKTSVIHALLLAREASIPGATTVQLNGPYGLELGTASDVLNIHTALDRSEVVIHAELADAGALHYTFDASQEALLYLPIKANSSTPVADRPPCALTGPNRAFTYLCAERLGPREILRASALRTEDLGVGVQGEFCAQLLAVHDLKAKVPPARRHPDHQDESSAFLKYQVEAWLSEIVRPVELETASFPNTTVTALRFRSPGGDWVRAPNMGFGVSYALPIILAGLFAPEGAESLLIVENPEAHLHPAGQSKIGAFLARLAQSGVQVILETHSDHVLNGIRRAIGEQNVLDADRAIAHFFDMESEAEPSITALRFTPAGGVSQWPRRFFDQYQLDVAALTRARRGPAR
ncbi:MAG: DUF3696 domain-containing protein [Candidatus Eisenbacteria bacterium]|jgi:predicted ATPase|nr:DUF3696 domain-containing protein [Candidatus Eisenbacteria bacterium]